MKPTVVFFGDNVPSEKVQSIYESVSYTCIILVLLSIVRYRLVLAKSLVLIYVAHVYIYHRWRKVTVC